MMSFVEFFVVALLLLVRKEVAAVDPTLPNYPGVALYYDDELKKELGGHQECIDYIGATFAEASAAFVASGMKPLTQVGQTTHLDINREPDPTDTERKSVRNTFGAVFGEDMSTLCSTADSNIIPDMALLFTGRVLDDNFCGYAKKNKACKVAIAVEQNDCASVESESRLAAGVVDLATSFSESNRPRAQVHYAAKMLAKMMGANDLSSNDYHFNLPQDVDYVMAKKDDYWQSCNPSLDAGIAVISANQCYESCTYHVQDNFRVMDDLYSL